jgi:hypothetical protein
MTPRITIIRKATFDPSASDGSGWRRISMKIRIDGEEFESSAPRSVCDATEINSSAERLVDFVNAVQLR